MNFIKVVKEGQIKEGDKLMLYSSRFEKFFNCTAKIILPRNGKKGEEIIVDKKNNKYFITQCVLDDTGGFGRWVNDVWIKEKMDEKS